jgi:subtilisin family serine protease
MKKKLLLLGAFLVTLFLLVPFFRSQAQDPLGPPVLKLHRGRFDAAAPGVFASMVGLEEPAPGPYAIIQFRSPPSPPDQASLAAARVQILEYLPEYAYLVSGSPSALDEAAALPQVYARVRLTLADKFSPGLLKALESGGEAFGRVKIGPWKGKEVQARQGLSALPFDYRAVLNMDQLLQIARLDAVRWIEPIHRSVLLNDYARNIMGVNTAWQDTGFYGTGQIIGVTDTGLDTGNHNTMSPDFAGRIAATYVLTTTGNWADEHGHGTHVAGSAAGAGVQSGAITATHSYTNSFAGTAPEAQLAIQAFEALGDGTIVGLPADYYTLFDQMYGSGARLHSNSWGDVTGPPGLDEYGGYITATQRTDEFIWDHPDMAVFFAAGNSGKDGDIGPLGLCVGGDGVIDPDLLLSPGTAKNVITVAASESDKNEGPYQDIPWLLLSLCFWTEPIVSDIIADNPEGMAAFSSRGPVDDGRIKPDITAPGVNIVSNRSQVPGATELWGAYDANYSYSGGTSMATPLTAGAGAIVREWLNLKGLSNPSAALIKATLLNTTHDMAPGQYGLGATQEITFTRPNPVTGWGRVDLGFLAEPPPFGIWFDDHTTGMSMGETVTYLDSLTQPLEVLTDTQPLRIMLVWTDPPASLSADEQLVNDLDLVVTGPFGMTYYGNDEPSGDRLNNVEGIVIDNPPVGTYQVDIEAFNIPVASQPYALVVAGPVDDGTAPPPTSTPTASNTPTATLTPTQMPTHTHTPTPSNTPILPPTETQTPLPTDSPPPPLPTSTPTGPPTEPTPVWVVKVYLPVVKR